MLILPVCFCSTMHNHLFFSSVPHQLALNIKHGIYLQFWIKPAFHWHNSGFPARRLRSGIITFELPAFSPYTCSSFRLPAAPTSWKQFLFHHTIQPWNTSQETNSLIVHLTIRLSRRVQNWKCNISLGFMWCYRCSTASRIFLIDLPHWEIFSWKYTP